MIPTSIFRRDRAWRWYIALSAILTLAYLFVPPFKGYAGLINLIGLGSPIAIVVGMRMHRPKATLAWNLLLAGQVLFVAGDFYTYSYPDLLGGKVGFPSAGDAIYLLVYPCLFAGLVLLVRSRNPGGDRAANIDSLILTVGVALLSWVFLVAPNIHASGLTLLAKVVSVAYPLGDVLLLAALMRLAVDAGRRTPAFFLLAGSIVAVLATDRAYNYALLVGSFHHQLIYDAGWIAYLVLWGAAALHPSMHGLDTPTANVRVRLTRTRLSLLAMACLIAPAVDFIKDFGSVDTLVVIAGSGCLFILVVARMAGLIRQEERMASREMALRRAGALLVAAGGLESVSEAIVAAARELVDDLEEVRLILWDGGDVRVAASSDAGGWELSAEAAEHLRAIVLAADPVEAVAFPANIARALLLGPMGETLLVRLAVRGVERGVLILHGPLRRSRHLNDSLEALASQVSLALDAASLAENLHRQKSEARFRSLVAHSSDLITVLDASGTVTYQSPSVERLLGYSVAEIEGNRFEKLLSRADRERLAPLVAAAGSETHTFECSLQHHDGRQLHFEIQRTELLGDEHIRGIVLNGRDISERKLFEEQLAHQAFHDPVTNLANRALFTDRVQHALRSTVRMGSLICVMFIDLDDFKTVNDSLGHPAGDAVLQEVARRLDGVVRPVDTAARFGGDEFAILLDGIEGSDQAAMVAVRLLTALRKPAEIDGKQVYPRASIGICMSDADLLSQDADELLRNADVAMYIAKRDLKGSYRLFEPAMHERVVERLELRADLEQALALDQLEVYYQPVVRLEGGTDYGVEALLRWNHPRRGIMPPADFIPLAEETGLIIPIGRWVLNEACRTGIDLQRRFPQEEPLRISVNLSVKQLQSASIVADVSKALESAGLPPESLVLEITETVLLADADIAIVRLRALKQLGVRIAMDDFGTGYSSLSYLSRLPVDILKMDRSFLSDDMDGNGLAAAIMVIGDQFGLEVVAEGIETQAQIDSLRRLGFELGQGFLFAKPMQGGDLMTYLRLASASRAA